MIFLKSMHIEERLPKQVEVMSTYTVQLNKSLSVPSFRIHPSKLNIITMEILLSSLISRFVL